MKDSFSSVVLLSQSHRELLPTPLSSSFTILLSCYVDSKMVIATTEAQHILCRDKSRKVVANNSAALGDTFVLLLSRDFPKGYSETATEELAHKLPEQIVIFRLGGYLAPSTRRCVSASFRRPMGASDCIGHDETHTSEHLSDDDDEASICA